MSKTNIMKIVKLGLENRIFDEMKQPSFTVESLTRKLNAEGVNITAQSVRKFISNTKQAQRELISKDLRTANELTKTIIDYSNFLKNIMDEVEEVKQEAKGTKDFATYNQMVDKLFKGVELIAKITGDIKPKGSVDINIIYNEINSNIEKDMRDTRTDIFNPKVIDIDYEISKEDTLYADKINKELGTQGSHGNPITPNIGSTTDGTPRDTEKVNIGLGNPITEGKDGTTE